MKPKNQRRKKGHLFLFFLIFTALLFFCLGAGIVFYFGRDLPEIDSLQYTRPKVASRIYDRNNRIVYMFGEEKRLLVSYNDISPNFFRALIAVEDAGFYSHHGISIKGIFRALIYDVFTGKRQQGGSTITQQLAKQYFLTPEKTIKRKIKEMLLAINIEQHYSKEQILTMYANKVYLGHGRYGIESASHYFFGKKAKDLNIEEGAMLAGMVRIPMPYSPKSHPDIALKRRNWVLSRMIKVGYLKENEAKLLMKKPIELREDTEVRDIQPLAPYFFEQIRQNMEEMFGEETLYEKGLNIYTGLDPAFQVYANNALLDGLREYDRRYGYRGPISHLAGADSYAKIYGDQTLKKDSVAIGYIMNTTRDSMKVKISGNVIDVTLKDCPFSNVTDFTKWFRRGSIANFLITKTENGLSVKLDQYPSAQGAILVLDPHSGTVRAFAGGLDFYKTMFDRVVLAKRQTGSAIKPMIYSCAFGNGFTLGDTILDEPSIFVYPDTPPERICMKGYIPHNYERTFFGTITLRKALEHSVNISTVRLLNAVGYHRVIEQARKMGITAPLEPYPSMALGAFEITLWELCGAYSTFPNMGLWVEPHMINKVVDFDGRTLIDVHPRSSAVLTPEASYITIKGMEGVIRHGTAASAASMKGHIAGKTGTTDEYTDAWFIGFNPNLLCGVWVGKDNHKPLGHGEAGSRAALPVWRRFMEKALVGHEDEDFPTPPNIVKVVIDPSTGLKATEKCPKSIEEFFISGNEPTQFCTPTNHIRLKLPYYLQGLPISDDMNVHLNPIEWNSVKSRFTDISYDGKSLHVGTLSFPAVMDPPPQNTDGGIHEGSYACGARVIIIKNQ